MKRSFSALLLCLVAIIFVFSIKALGQTRVIESVPAGTVSDTQRSDMLNRQATGGTVDVHADRLGEIVDRTGAHQLIPSALLSSRLKKVLYPAASDREANASFLHQPQTGIFRLIGCLPVVDVKAMADAPCVEIPIVGHGAYYSFTKKRNDFDEWSDLALRNNTLQAGVNDNTLGMLMALGDVPLESVTLETPEVSFLAQLVPPTNPAEAQTQIESLAHGVKIGGRTFASSLPVALNTTYLLRSTKYQRSDALIALRVIRQEPSSSVTILWKQLQKFHTPSLNSKHQE